MDKKETAKYKQMLEQEQARIELELTDIGHINPSNHADWIGSNGDYDTGTADPNILADRVEEISTNDAIVNNLEVRLEQVNKALEKIENGTYGTCEKCGEDIPEERLKANPAATTCIEHTDDF